MHFCGGWIINTRWVGSVAHCTFGRSGPDTVVVVGTIELNLRAGIGAAIRATRIINHENYSPTTLANDLSVLHLERSIVIMVVIRPIPIGSSFVQSGPATISGWGHVRVI